MKRLFVLLLCALSLPAFAAGKSSLTVEMVPDVLAEKWTTEESTKIVTGVRGAGETGKYSLAASYYEAGKPIYTEIIEFRSAGEQPILVELLAFAPQQRDALLNGYKNHSVTLEHPDGSVENLPFAHLLADSPDQLATGKVVVTPISVTSPKSPGSTDINAIFAASSTCDEYCCKDECDLYYNQCESGCGVAPAEDCLLRCEAQLADCYEDCEGCPHVTEYWVTTLDSETYTYQSKCLDDHIFSGAKWYEEMERTWKHTKYRETEECDGSYTTVVIQVTYSVDYCWKRTGFNCYSPDPNSQFYCQY